MTVRKHIGALTAVLGGIDSLVFTGGIGERSGALRAEICEGLEHLGVGTGRVVRARRRAATRTASSPATRQRSSGRCPAPSTRARWARRT